MPAEPSVPSKSSARHYGMDWLRIGAFGLLIFYHVGLAFSNWPYEFKAIQTYDWVAFPLLTLNAWRLSLLFAISGYASAALLARTRGPTAFLRGRLARLGIPLLFGIAVITAPQPWIWLTMAMGYDHDFTWFLANDYYTFRDIDGINVPSWMHLWFVVYLLVYTILLSALALLPAAWARAARRGVEQIMSGPLLLPIGIAWIFGMRQIGDGWADTHTLISDPAAHAVYGPVFFFGVLLRNSERLRQAIVRQWKIALFLAISGYLVVASYEWYDTGLVSSADEKPFLLAIARATQGWCAIIALFGIADRFWNRDGRWRATLAEAAFPFYIVHQTLIFVAGYTLRPFQPSPMVEFVILVGVTAVGSVVFYAVGRAIGPVRPLIGLRRHAARPTPAK